MQFRPLHDRVVVRRIDADQKTSGGIIIPDTVQEKPQEGEVIAIGPGARNERGDLVPTELKGARAHQRSMRLNDQWRLILEIIPGRPKNRIRVCAIEDYH